jgi:hypothetical protein
MDDQNLISVLERNGFSAKAFANAEAASAYLNNEIDGRTVGFGGSMTLLQMNLYETLSAHNQVSWHWKPADGLSAPALLQAAARAEIYLTSVNGLAETGELINIDGTGNRVSSMLYGHSKVYFIVGANKIAPTFADALWRARNIAAPRNAQRLKRQTPCAAKADRCYNCSSPDRICKGLVVLWQKMIACAMEVILIDENLGY